MAPISLHVNGSTQSVETHSARTLLDVLREDLGLTGAKYGCGEGSCRSCTVLMDRRAVSACQVAIEDAAGKAITTIEGLSRAGELHPMQQAFLDEGAFQCAFCTSGMIIAAIALLERNTNPTAEQIRDGMNGNVCRCCVQPQILKAVRRASNQMAGR